MDNSMAWIGYDQVYKQHFRGAVPPSASAAAAVAVTPNGSNVHQARPSPSGTPHHHSGGVNGIGGHGSNPYSQHVQNHSAMLAAHHYCHNSMITGSSQSTTSTPNVMPPSQHSQFVQHQSTNMLPSCPTNSMFSTTDVNPHYSSHLTSQHQSSHSSSSLHDSSKQFSASSYSQNSNSSNSTISKSLNSGNTSKSNSAKHISASSTSSTAAAVAAATAAANSLTSGFDPCYYRSAKDAYQSGSNPWSILNSCGQSLRDSSAIPIPSTPGVGVNETNHSNSASIHHSNNANQTKCLGTLASSQSVNPRISSNLSTPNAVSSATSFNTFDQYEQTTNNLNAFMNQNHWNQQQNSVSKQSYESSLSAQMRLKSNEHLTHLQHRQNHSSSVQQQHQSSIQQQQQPSSQQQQQQHHHHQAHHQSQHAQQFGAQSDISPSLSSSSRYFAAKANSVNAGYPPPNTNYSDYPSIGPSDILHSWHQNYAMARATYQQKCAANEAMINGFSRGEQTPSTPASTNVKTSNFYTGNYARHSQASHFDAATNASSYFPSMVPNFSASQKAAATDTYFAAVAAEMQQRKHLQQQQQQQNSQNLHHNQQNFHQNSHNQNISHNIHDSYSSSMMSENHTQNLMNYSNSFFPNEVTVDATQQQSVSTSSTSNKTKTKRTPKRSKSATNSTSIQQQQQRQQQPTPNTVLPDYSYSNYSQCNGGSMPQQAMVQPQQRSLSRCSSVSSQHHQPQHQHRTSESSNSHYNNYSPATTTGHSPYHTGGSSQTPCLGTTNGAPAGSVNANDSGYYSGGTVFPNQASTPTPGGYPTPPSSVGQNSNPRCNSNGELSPYSSNSMSSTMSQSYTNPGSSKTSNSQISPVHSHETVDPTQYHSSCMMQKNDDSFYQTQQAFTDNAYSDNGPVQNANNNELYLDYGNSEPTVNDSNTYAHQYENAAHYDSTEAYHEQEIELSSCSKVSTTVPLTSSPEAVLTFPETDDYHRTQHGEHHAESFDLNFDSVIPNIDNSTNVSSKVDNENNHSSGDSIPSVDILLPSMEEMNHHFIEHQQQNVSQQQHHQHQTTSNLEYSSHSLLSNDSSSQQQQQQQQPQQHLHNSSMLDDDEPMVECSQIHSIIESLPQTDLSNESTVNNNVNSETNVHHSTSASDCLTLSQQQQQAAPTTATTVTTTASTAVSTNETTLSQHDENDSDPVVDEYPPDLAPLLADSTKIALMESTFKSPTDVDNLPKITEHCDDEDSTERLEDLDEFLISEGEPINQIEQEDEQILSRNDIQCDKVVDTSISTPPTTTATATAQSQPQQQQPQVCEKAIIISQQLQTQPFIADIPSIKNQEFDMVNSKQSQQQQTQQSKNKNKRKLSEDNIEQNDNILKNETNDNKTINDTNQPKKRKVAVVHPKSKETKKEIKIEFLEPTKEHKEIKKTKTKDKIKIENKKINHKDVWNKNSQDKKAKKKMTISEMVTNKIENTTEKKKIKIIEKVKANNKKQSKIQNINKIIENNKTIESKSPNSRMEAKENVSKPHIIHNNNLKPKINNKKIIPKIEISPMPAIPVMIKPTTIPGAIVDSSNQTKAKISKPKQISPKPKKVAMKEVAISPKPAAGTATLFNSPNNVNKQPTTTISIQRPQNVLSPVGTSLTVPNQPSKAKTPPVSFGTTQAPTLIVNQSGPQPYQMQQMTNASPMMLISIHHPTLHPSATAPSTFILNTQNSIQSSNSANNPQVGAPASLTTPSSVSRRKSQDKKLTTVREGLMRTSDFVVAEDEAQLPNPVIWRIEGKSLLQRFESTEQNGQTVYVNTSSYSAWNPTVREKYLGLDVRILGCNRSRTVVEKIGLTAVKKSESNTATPEKESSEGSTDGTVEISNSNDGRKAVREDLSAYFDNFEVYVQTLVSQALDPNFIAEIVKENDDYFVSHMNAIDELCVERKTRFLTKQKWDSNLVKCIDLYPKTQIHQQSDVGDLRCRLCHDNWSTKILQFEGDVYNLKTLEIQEQSSTELKQTKLALCDSCTDKAFLYSKMQHQKYNFYVDCKTKVQNIITQDENKDSREILDECLGDNDWIKELFSKLETMLLSAERYSK